jgi:hypothetical protein
LFAGILASSRKSWTNQFGETFTFDELMEHLLKQPLGKGCCGGCHVPYTVVTILRIDAEQYPILSPKMREHTKRWLGNVIRILEKNQLPDGSWERDWGKTGQKSFLYGDKTLDVITILGHHLEWMALSLEEWRPSKYCIKKSVDALSEQIDQLPELRYRSFKTLLPCSHAAKAMCLIRNVNSYQFWLTSTASNEARSKK